MNKNTQKRDYYSKAHKASIHNKMLLKNDKLCGCFYCCTIFRPDDIKEWADESPRDDTAICPYCGIDAVIAESAGYPLTYAFLNEMMVLFFGKPSESDTKRQEQMRRMVDVYYEYTKNPEKTRIIDGVTYYKVVDRYVGSFSTVFIPYEAISNGERKLRDENGLVFNISAPAHFLFRGEVPEWYSKVACVHVKSIQADCIGQYITAMSQGA